MSVAHVSDVPWSSYSESDYTLQQWHNACLIHLHDGAPTSKSECKLPVKTPAGVVNRNGVHAAAAVLAGARGGVHASSEQKASAMRSIVRLYGQLNEQPPDSMKQENRQDVEEFLRHHGVKGQQWGVRRAAKKAAKAEAKWENKPMKPRQYLEAVNVAGELFNRDIAGINNSKRFAGKDFNHDSPDRRAYYAAVQKMYQGHLDTAAQGLLGSPSGTRHVKLIAHGPVDHFPTWEIVNNGAQHADMMEGVNPIINLHIHDGFIVGLDISVPKDNGAVHQQDVGEFLDHHGVKGQKWGVRKPRGDRSAFVARATGRDLSKLSDQELRDAVGRMQLERQFRDLSKSSNKSFGASGKRFAADILKDVGKQHARKLITEGIAAAGTIATGALIAKKMSG